MELLQSSALPLGYVARRRWSGWRESNPRVNLGKVAGYHYITPARLAAFWYRAGHALPHQSDSHPRHAACGGAVRYDFAGANAANPTGTNNAFEVFRCGDEPGVR